MVPKSPYGVSKLYSYWITKVYREAYSFYAAMEYFLIMKVLKRRNFCNKENNNVFCKKKKLGSNEFFI